MPRRPMRPCAEPGCTALVERGRCEKHQAAQHRQQNAARGTAYERGYADAEHLEWRRQVLERDRWCVDPDRRHPGVRVLATVSDHIVPRGSGGARLDPANGQGLCHGCHNAKTARERAKPVPEPRRGMQ